MGKVCTYKSNHMAGILAGGPNEAKWASGLTNAPHIWSLSMINYVLGTCKYASSTVQCTHPAPHYKYAASSISYGHC